MVWIMPSETSRTSAVTGLPPEMVTTRALDAGINPFDTADQYSGEQSEEMLGKALSRRRGRRRGDEGRVIHTRLFPKPFRDPRPSKDCVGFRRVSFFARRIGL